MTYGFDPGQERHADRIARKVSERLQQPVARRQARCKQRQLHQRQARSTGAARLQQHIIRSPAELTIAGKTKLTPSGAVWNLTSKEARSRCSRRRNEGLNTVGLYGTVPRMGAKPQQPLGFYTCAGPSASRRAVSSRSSSRHSSKSASARCSRLRTASLVCASSSSTRSRIIRRR